MARTHGSCTYRALGGDEWTLDQHLLALAHDQLAISNWQRSKDGAKGRNRPKPISPLAKKRGSKLGRTSRSPEEVKAMLARYGPRPAPDPTPAELRDRVDAEWLRSQMELATE